MSIVYHADKGKPLTAQEVDGNFATIAAMSTGHAADRSNPHSVTKAQVGLSAVDNTADLAKPVSAAQAEALGLKANAATLAAHTGDTANPHGVTKAQVGLGNCNNTSDANKPISTAQQAALDLKANLSSPEFSGIPTAPLAVPGSSTAQIASAAFVQQELAAVGLGGMLVAANNLSDLEDVGDARDNLGLGGAAVLNVGTGPETICAGDDPRLDSTGADATARDLAVFNSLLSQIGLGRASGAIPSGFMDLFLTDELPTKTNGAYVAAGDYYHNPGSYVDETANLSSIAQVNFNQGGTCTLAALRDGTLTGGCGTQDETGSSVDLIFSTSKSIGKISFYNYANSERLKAFTIQRYNAGAWVKVPIVAITEGGTIINTDEGQVSNANGWVTCEFTAVSDTRFRLAFTSVWGLGDVNAYLTEAKIYSYSPPPSMTLIPTPVTAGSAPGTVDIYVLHKAVDAATANTDFKARVTRDGGSNWSAHATLVALCQFDADYKLYRGSADLSALASGTSVAWEFTTLNTKAQRLRAVAMILNS